MSEITYYEDEIYKPDFQLNQSENYKELMGKYLKDKEYLKDKDRGWKYHKRKEIQKKPPYLDPEAVEGYKDCLYYSELTQFLRKREDIGIPKDYKKYEYVAPTECKKDKQEESKYPGSKKNEIIAYFDGKERLRLKSDLFGFSVKNFEDRPYGILWNWVQKKDEDKRNEDYEFIAECIYRTRTLGGGFLWQIDAGIGKRGMYGYNTDRGQGKSYIEDRVDLTLLEIKHLFEWIERCCMDEKNLLEAIQQEKGYEYTDDTLWCTIKKQKQKKEVLEYIRWLQHFGSFENYIQFFCFDDFVDNADKYNTWMPLDIMKSELEWDDESKSLRRKKVVFLEEPTEYKLEGTDSYEKITKMKLSAEELKQMLKNVASLTLARSYRMQEVIDGI